MAKAEVADGKYTVIFEENTGRLYVLRYGNIFKELPGDGVTLALLREIVRLKDLAGVPQTTVEEQLDYTAVPSSLMSNRVK